MMIKLEKSHNANRIYLILFTQKFIQKKTRETGTKNTTMTMPVLPWKQTNVKVNTFIKLNLTST